MAFGRIRRAAAYGTFDGWTIAIFAALSFVCGLSSVVGIAMGIGMGTIAAVELWAVGRLRRLDPAAARMLGFNQIAFALVLIVYAVWSLHTELGTGAAVRLLVGTDPAVESLVGPIANLAGLIAWVLYGGLMAVAIFCQGGAAIYYFTRVKHVEAYLRDTPAWILQMHKAEVWN